MEACLGTVVKREKSRRRIVKGGWQCKCVCMYQKDLRAQMDGICKRLEGDGPKIEGGSILFEKIWEEQGVYTGSPCLGCVIEGKRGARRSWHKGKKSKGAGETS